jgi:hydrogenase expression/formation protein HypE
MMRDSQITLAHGSGGRAMHELIEQLFLEHFSNPHLDGLEDCAVLDVGRTGLGLLAFSTDSYVVNPIFFPGGDIGKLAVYGTINDLAMSGARPLYLSAGFILEEGFPFADLRRIVQSMAAAAREAEIAIVTGDTKVVERGCADKIFINTSGLGAVESAHRLSASRAMPGDKIIVSGTIGDHGTAVMIARGDLELESEIASDTASLSSLVQAILSDSIRCMRDPTRGGLATTLNEIARSSNVHIRIFEERIPIRTEVTGACELLGLDPLYVANEGKLVAVVAAEAADSLLDVMRRNALGRDAAVIGEVKSEPRGMVSMVTQFGGTRVVDMLAGEQLPRIC